MKFVRLASILAATLLLSSCLLTPGRFTSTLDVKRDRSFTFTYVGEVIHQLPDETVTSSASSEGEDGQEEEAPKPKGPKVETEEQKAKRRAIAETLSKEQGYRSVQYLGDGKFRIDFAISGRLDHNFVYPFNPDADAIFPWIAIELRKDGTARMKAAAFGDMQSSAGMGQPNVMGDAEGREGSFTLTTDAELVMHNNEEGAAAPGRVTWRVTPSSKTVPTAVLRFGS